jgi:nitrogen fixation/metabolism regulation signal transduction histidine kinase
MGSNRYYITIIFNCMLIFGCAFLFFYFLQVRQQPSTATGIGILALILTFRLIYFVNRTNRILGHFISYMHEQDPSLHYSIRYVKKHFRGLHESMERLITELKESRINLELQAHYLESILDNVSTGIFCFDNSGKILTMNRKASLYLHVERLTHMEELDRKQPGLSNRILEMRPETEITETLADGGKSIKLAIYHSRIILKNEDVHIIAVNDISMQMEEQEILSWKKLIRVINHEIMNSMTPIITLSMAIRRKLARGDRLEDAIQSASIIEERSKDLVQFIERYKKLTALPPMKVERFPAGDLFEKMEQLFREELKDKGVCLKRTLKCNGELEADRQMLEQMLINLIKNSMEALENCENPEINLSCYPNSNNHICLTVGDNGEGIMKDKQEQVFVPFFTTREKGSGIGLSLCKQIIRLHHGSIDIKSTPGQGTIIIIELNLIG